MDETIAPVSNVTSKKRKTTGRLSDAAKKLRTQTHETGPPCNCTKLQCFNKMDEMVRLDIIRNFNELPSYDAQNLYLSGFVECNLVKQRKNRKPAEEATFHSYSYKYKVRVLKNGSVNNIPVCYKAFLSLYGITPRRLQHIQNQLTEHGKVAPDGRGKHKNRPRALSEETKNKVHEHIQSLKGRKSHYSLGKTEKLYLPEDLDVKKLHKMYMEKYNNFPLSYDSYRKIFINDYNISFGYPRSDTCSQCDESTSKAAILNKNLETVNNEEKVKVTAELHQIQVETMLHKKKAEVFYSRKRNSRIKASKEVEYEAVAFDFQKILPVPNITTNDVYYKRQLSVYFFNVHILSTGDSVFYCYDQTIAKRGCNDVVSMLHHFIFNVLPSTVKRLSLFCDSCSGQNKNFTMFRYLYYVVHICKRFENVQVTFPIRGHSYMECDRNMALIPKKIPAEVPEDWYQAVENCRIKPNPFQVVRCTQEMFKDWNSFFNTLKMYKPKLAIPSRPIREAYISNEKSKLMLYRINYNGAWESTVLLQNVSRQKKTVQRATNSNSLPNGEFLLPDKPAYSSLIPLATKKWENLQVTHLKMFPR